MTKAHLKQRKVILIDRSKTMTHIRPHRLIVLNDLVTHLDTAAAAE